MSDNIAAARADLAPSGTLQVGINFANILLTARDPVTRAPSGVALDLAHEFGKRLGVPVKIIHYESAGGLAESASKGEWQLGFLAIEPKRANEITFTAAYVEIEATYLVPPNSPLKSLHEVDRAGVRIAVTGKAAYDLYLTRTLKNAELFRTAGAEETFKLFVDEKMDALAGLRSQLEIDQEKMPGSRILPGRFTAVQQAAGTPRGHEAGARYLAAFIEEMKASGFVARAIEKNNIRGLTVAAAAKP
ncbi:MAG: putative extracellular solute-binding protein [Betaproteobacteria bacterium]|nr:putative extracellular solute-binding protein [Betaproteobacteria bacterium]